MPSDKLPKNEGKEKLKHELSEAIKLLLMIQRDISLGNKIDQNKLNLMYANLLTAKEAADHI